MSYKLDVQEIAQEGINTTNVSLGVPSLLPIFSDLVTITGNLANSVNLAFSPGSPFDGFPIIVTSNDEGITDYNLFLSALGTGLVSLGSVLGLKSELANPDVVTVGAIFFNADIEQFVLGMSIDDVATWVPLPTSFPAPTPQSSGVIINNTDSPYDILVDDDIISVVTSAGAVTLNLPSTADVDVWKIYKIKDQSGNAATNNITVTADGAENIDGVALYDMNNPFESITVYSNGTNWLIL